MYKRSFIIFGVIPSVLMFIFHDALCSVDMNPLCYLKCAALAIINLPFLFLDDGKKGGN